MFRRIKDWRLVATRYDKCPDLFFLAICFVVTVIFRLCALSQALSRVCRNPVIETLGYYAPTDNNLSLSIKPIFYMPQAGVVWLDKQMKAVQGYNTYTGIPEVYRIH